MTNEPSTPGSAKKAREVEMIVADVDAVQEVYPNAEAERTDDNFWYIKNAADLGVQFTASGAWRAQSDALPKPSEPVSPPKRAHVWHTLTSYNPPSESASCINCYVRRTLETENAECPLIVLTDKPSAPEPVSPQPQAGNKDAAENADVAQLIELRVSTLDVAGSTPAASSITNENVSMRPFENALMQQQSPTAHGICTCPVCATDLWAKGIKGGILAESPLPQPSVGYVSEVKQEPKPLDDNQLWGESPLPVREPQEDRNRNAVVSALAYLAEHTTGEARAYVEVISNRLGYGHAAYLKPAPKQDASPAKPFVAQHGRTQKWFTFMADTKPLGPFESKAEAESYLPVPGCLTCSRNRVAAAGCYGGG